MTRTIETVAKVALVLLGALLLLRLAACSRAEFVDTFCTSYQPITYSASGDTEQTKAQIRGNNAAWSKVCK